MAFSYCLTADRMIVRSDGAYIPSAPLNADFQSYQAWLAAGNTPTSCAAPSTPIPQQVSRRQFFQAVAQTGMITQAEALALLASGTMPASLAGAMATLPEAERFAAQMSVLGDTVFARSNQVISAIWTAMGKTATDLDALFKSAASL